MPDSSGEIVGMDAGLLFLRSDRRIPESSSIEISFPQVKISGVVENCRRVEADWVISVAMTPGRRRLERMPVGEDTTLAVIENGAATLRRARIVDASGSGMGIRVPRPLTVGLRVCVETQATLVFGEVRYCRHEQKNSFAAGISILEVVPDVRTQSSFSLMLANLRRKVGSRLGVRQRVS